MTRVICFSRVLLVCLFPIHGHAEITIEGIVNLPPPKANAAYARYAQKAGTVDAPELPVAVVFLEGSFAKAPAPGTNSAAVTQKNYQFHPNILPVQKGASVEFPNQDGDYHHVFSYSKAKEFDLGRYRKDEKAPAVLYDKPGLVKVGCEIHEHMRAFILVLDTPYFTKTQTNGAYRLVIKEPLDGKYVLKAWVDEKNVREQSVELKEGAVLQANFPGK
jgi:plastocyanin